MMRWFFVEDLSRALFRVFGTSWFGFAADCVIANFVTFGASTITGQVPHFVTFVIPSLKFLCCWSRSVEVINSLIGVGRDED